MDRRFGVLLGCVLLAGCGTKGSFEGIANVNGTDHAFSSGCELDDGVESGEFNAVASDHGHGSGFWGFSMLWTDDTVPEPGSYQVGFTADVHVFVHRRDPTESGDITYSSAGAGTVVFDVLDTGSVVSGQLVGVRMERNNPDDMNVIVVDGDFVCER